MSERHSKRVGITRALADKLIAELPGRAREMEADPSYLHYAVRIAVFGSYLDPQKQKLGDIDVAIEIGRKEKDGERYVEQAQALADREAPRSYGWAQRFCFAGDKFIRGLRARHNAFSFHEWSDLEALEAKYGTKGRIIYQREDTTTH
jgi:predicted nucleotidyltransferase